MPHIHGVIVPAWATLVLASLKTFGPTRTAHFAELPPWRKLESSHRTSQNDPVQLLRTVVEPAGNPIEPTVPGLGAARFVQTPGAYGAPRLHSHAMTMRARCPRTQPCGALRLHSYAVPMRARCPRTQPCGALRLHSYPMPMRARGPRTQPCGALRLHRYAMTMRARCPRTQSCGALRLHSHAMTMRARCPRTQPYGALRLHSYDPRDADSSNARFSRA